jgi:nucleotide-binding universal stress UspA family protein
VPKILIAFDDSENAMRAVDYVARFLAKDSRVTLFSVIIDSDRELTGSTGRY